jgi:hypothetical protein
MIRERHVFSKSDAEALAIQAMAFLTENPDSLSLFVGLTGVSGAEVRSRLTEPAFLVGVLEFLMGDEQLVLGFAEALKIDPTLVGRAHHLLDR